MARPKEFDVDQAIDNALDLFWSNGFEATSVQQIVDHLGIQRGSIYSTFGSKEGLYRRAFDRYCDNAVRELTELLTPEGNVDDGTPLLRDRIEALLVSVAADPERRGCFIVNTVVERNARDPASREFTAAAIDGTRGRLQVAFEEAAQRGELNPTMKPAVAADVVLVTMQGLRVMTKAGAGQPMLKEVIGATVDRLFS